MSNKHVLWSPFLKGFAEGLTSWIRVLPYMALTPPPPKPRPTDAEALRGDWIKVGGDMHRAMKQLDAEIKRRKS